MKRLLIGLLLLLAVSGSTKVIAYSPERYPIVKVQFYQDGELTSSNYKVDLLVPREELYVVWVESGVEPHYLNRFINYADYPYMQDDSEFTSYLAYVPYDTYIPSPDNQHVQISNGDLLDFSEFQLVIYDEQLQLVYTTDVMNVYDTFGDSMFKTEGNHYFNYHIDSNELEMVPYEEVETDMGELVGVLAIVAFIAIIFEILPVLLLWFAVVCIAFIIMIVWIKKGQQKSPKI